MEIFWFKKLVGMLIMPLPAIIILFVFGFWLYYRGKRRGAIALLGSALVSLFLCTTPWLPNALLEPLEQYVPQYDQGIKVQSVVVLGCDHSNDFRLSSVSQLRGCSLYRLIEGIRVMKANPGSRLILSGGSKEQFSNAEAMRDVALSLGVNRRHILLQSHSRDTEQEALAIKPLVKQQTFALVTSAYHMRRALRIFAHQGMHPIAAPTEHLVKRSGSNGYGFNWLPRGAHLRKVELFWYETLGYWWLLVRGY